MPQLLACPLCQGDRTVRMFDALDHPKALTINGTTLLIVPESRKGTVVVCPHCHGKGRIERNGMYIPNSDLRLNR